MVKHDDETYLERRDRERCLRISESSRKFEGVLRVAGETDRNGVRYTVEALKSAVERWQKSQDAGQTVYGGLYSLDLAIPVALEDITFEVTNVRLENDELRSLQEVIVNTQNFEKTLMMLELEKEAPGRVSIGMAGLARESDTDEDGVLIVKDFEIQRVSLLPTNEKG